MKQAATTEEFYSNQIYQPYTCIMLPFDAFGCE